MKVAFFGYAWNPQLQVDAYMGETIDSLVRAGCDVDVYLGSQISETQGIYGLRSDVSPDQLHDFIAGEGYDGAISFNNSMLLPQVLAAIEGKVATVIVDEPEHLFDYRRAGPMSVFAHDVEIIAMSTAVEQRISKEVEGARPRMHYMLPATFVGAQARPSKPVHPVSWIASFVGDSNLDQYIMLMTERADYNVLTQRCLNMLARGQGLSKLSKEELELIKALPWSFGYFTAQMHNILTNRSRVEVVERLAPLGLALFGNKAWHKLLTHNAAVMTALQPGVPPSRHEDLRRIYDASKISINVPQSHIARGAVQYRVIDVMASQALMITRRDQPSDLYRVFGADCPVPTYTDLPELQQLCSRYLKDEPERRRLVARCNALVAEGFSFEERARTLLNIIGLEPRPGAAPGHRRPIDLRLFYE